MPLETQNPKRETPLPPGQQLVAANKWPIVGERAAVEISGPWTVEIRGSVERPSVWSLDDLRALPQVDRVIDIHCVTRWSKPGVRFGGVLLETLLKIAGAQPHAGFASLVARTARNHSTSLILREAIELGTLVALSVDGAGLPADHGGPVRVVTPGRYFYKSLKWLAAIDLLAEDRLGYWESEAGYHNHADPWREERFIAANLSKQETAKLLAARDFSGRDLLGIAAARHDLTGLNARGALLRNADFRHCNLRGADFTAANLSDAHFNDADLAGAIFREADVEGANFAGADLRGADFTAASMIAATFFAEDAPPNGPSQAIVDSTTRIEPAQFDQLTPRQVKFLMARLSAVNAGRDK